MSKDFERYIEQLAQDLHDAAALKAWDIPIAHRTKDSISAYRASVGIVGAVMLKTLAKYQSPDKVAVAPELVPTPTPTPVPPQMDEPVITPQSLFSDEPSPEPRRRRRNAGESDAA